MSYPVSENHKYLYLFSDGASRGNPGPSATGWCIQDNKGIVILRGGRFLGKTTNNIAEYTAAIDVLQAAQQLHATHVVLHADSELLIKQLSGAYAVRSPHLLPLFTELKNLAAQFINIKYQHIYREQNSLADSEANKALDTAVLAR